jgi:hypothetical protein
MRSRPLQIAALGVAILVAILVPAAGAFQLGGTTPGKWGPPAMGTGATVTWSLMATGTPCPTWQCSGGSVTALADFMPAGFETAVQAAFAAWSAVASIAFIPTADSGAAFNADVAAGDIRIGGAPLGQEGLLAEGFFPPDNGMSAAGDIFLDMNAALWTLDPDAPQFSVFQVLAHEIGHAIGLDHTTVPDSLLNLAYTEAFWGPQADDIAGARFIYGAVHAVPLPPTLAMVVLGIMCAAAAHRRARRGA